MFATLSALIRLLRPHQWAKNLLVFVAVLTAHRHADVLAWVAASRLFIAFCLCASAIYVVNDAADAGTDRLHPDKAKRPFASGALSPRLASVIAPMLLLFAAWVASRLPHLAIGSLLTYVVLSLAYTAVLKRVLWLDVLTLAILYVLRVAAGAFAILVPLSPWLLGFALFMFMSLATLKRYGELVQANGRPLDGRAYRGEDLPIVLAVGTASALTAILVFVLYARSTEVRAAYGHPDLLWLVAPALLYWLARLWTLAGRGMLRSDPILFALRDPASHLSGLALLAVFWCAL